MKFQGISKNFTDVKADALAIAVFSGETPKKELKEFDDLTGGIVSQVYANEEFKGEVGETALIRFKPSAKGKADRLLLIGAGKVEDYKASDAAKISGCAVRFLRKRNVKSFALLPRSADDAALVAENVAHGALSSQFELDKYKSKDRESKFVETLIACVDGADKDIKAGLERGQFIGESMNFTRDLANEPPNVLTPTEMAKRAAAMAKETGLKCEILDEAKMTKLGMGSLMSVSFGSEQPAQMIVLRYTPAKANKAKPVALVGKGITFDTGGISLKPGEGMDAMKYDMSGGATVLGAMRAIALIKPSVPVIGIVAAVENMPDGKASRPSDVVTASNGKTVEILNTDAEGRLILADAIAYAEKQGADTIIDMATLTGAVIVALGDCNTGIMGNDQDLMNAIIACGKEEGEGFWQLPVGKEYSKMIKSDIADIKNIGPRGKAGTIMGAVFLQEFVDKAKWAHLDIAGTAWLDSANAHQGKGPTAVAVRTLVRYVSGLK